MIFCTPQTAINNLENLEKIITKLKKLKTKKYKHHFTIPGLWIESEPTKIEVNPYDFFLDRIGKIINSEKKIRSVKEHSVYNMFVRLTSAYDHNDDGSLSYKDGMIRETGTFLKAIALLPYIQQLGVNTIYLLPVNSIGEDAKKGTLGSPYSVRNHYEPDSNLSEPLLELDIYTEFRAFSEAVHILGMKLICEFVFRTASIDSDLALSHPEWFYWIYSKIKNRLAGDNSEAKYGAPLFLKKELEIIKSKINSGDLTNLPQPHEQHIKMFSEIPKKTARVEGKIRGLLADKKTETLIPGAFADWPPDDNQPAWSDVTFLRLYDHPKFNYIAYNTIRMYDTELSKPQYVVKDLWDYISGIIPHYSANYHIDGVMIDMGHALPVSLRQQISSTALAVNKDFIFWEENFDLNENSVKDGYSAVLGYLPFDLHKPEKIRKILKRFADKEIPINFFATGESHNTPRVYARISDKNHSRNIYAISAFIPAITFIHSGFELCESNPVNTGLDFSAEDILKYPAEKLGLFSDVQLNWNSKINILEDIKKINLIKEEFISDQDDIFDNSIVLLDTNKSDIIAFIRRSHSNQSEIALVISFSNNIIENCLIDFLSGVSGVFDIITNDYVQSENGKINLNLQPYDLKIFKLDLY